MTSNISKPKASRGRQIVLWIIMIIIVLLIAIYLGICTYAAMTVTQIGEHEQYDKTPATYGPAHEEVRFPARGDDLEIAARYLPHTDSPNAVMLVHGRDASKQNAMSGTMVEFAVKLNEAGFSVLMIDMRGHGESEGERYSFGVYERGDVLGSFDWLKAQSFDSGHIGALGISMGGGATIGAMAEDAAIGVLVLDSTFADINPLIQELWEEESGLPKFFLPGMYLMTRLMYGYDLPSVRPVEEIVQIPPRPILILHCTSDEMVDVIHAEQLSEAVPSAETWYKDGCDHAEVYRDFPGEYVDHVITFFMENLK